MEVNAKEMKLHLSNPQESLRERCGKGRAKQQPHERKYCFIKQIKKHFIVNSFNAKFCQQYDKKKRKKMNYFFILKEFHPPQQKIKTKLDFLEK